jgi:hypothetical protein
MTTPYANPNFDNVVGHSGSQYLFPVKELGSADPSLAKAVNALFYDDASRWPTAYTVAGNPGTAIPLDTTLTDSPDAHAVANWLAFRDQDQRFIPGASAWATLPSWVDVTHDDASGTVPYINPATSNHPDAVYALNYLLDHNSLI